MSIKIACLSIVRVLLTIIALYIVDYALMWLLDNVILSFFNWFNERSIWLKLVLLVFGFVALFWSLVRLVGVLMGVASSYLFRRLPDNWFTQAISLLICLANIIGFIVVLWKIPEVFNIWVVCEFMAISFLILGVSVSIAAPKKQISNE